MLKLLLTILSLALPLHLYGQGTVNFANNSSSRVCDGVSGNPVPAGNTYTVGLYYAPDGTTDQSLFTMLSPTANFAAPGIFNAGARTAPISPPGGFGMFQVRAWSTSLGATYESALAAAISGQSGKLGKSNIVRVDTGDPTINPPGTPGSLVASGLQSFSVGGPLGGSAPCVPEPGTWAIALLGVITLLFARARKL